MNRQIQKAIHGIYIRIKKAQNKSDIQLSNNIIYTLMGQQTSIPSQRNLQQKYYTKLIRKHVKTNDKFQQEIKSVRKRLQYLNYKWAQNLVEELKGDRNRLYNQYQTTLKENCLRQGKRQKPFCRMKTHNVFLEYFDLNYNVPIDKLTPELLQEAFQQGKCYFMVMSWLYQLVSLKTNDQQNEPKGGIPDQWDWSGEEKVFSLLLNLSLKTYKKCTRSCPKSARPFQQCRMNSMMAKLLKRLASKDLSFAEKQMIISKIQQIVRSEPLQAEKLLWKVKQILGEDQIYAHLKTIRQVGHIDVSYLCEKVSQFSIIEI